MSVQMFRALALAATLAAVGVSGAVLFARQASESVFTAEQAAAGRAAYAKHCASCHMPDLSGNTEIPPLAGAVFIGTWAAAARKTCSITPPKPCRTARLR
jgi:mono/diheme cytochrome c family protein